MPLTDFQRGVARLIAANRKPESHIAGGAVINRGESALCISKDLDIFQDASEIVAVAMVKAAMTCGSSSNCRKEPPRTGASSWRPTRPVSSNGPVMWSTT
jgi:hypothetical protein